MYLILSGGDTVTSLAQTYLGSEDLAIEIVTANQLDPPFISQDQNFVSTAPAVGSVRFTLVGAGPLTIPAATVVQAQASASGVVRSYTTDGPITLNSTGNSATVGVTCTVPGPNGNIAPGRVNTTVGYAASTVAVTNPGSISGGVSLHVLLPGDRIWIPDPNDATTQATATNRQPLARYDLAGGVGIVTTASGGLAWGTDDVVLTEGILALGTEVANRLRTPKGTLFYDGGSGSLLPALKGNTGADALAQAAILAQADALQDDRLEAAVFTVEPYATGWLLLHGNLTTATGDSLQLSVPIT